MIRYNHYSLIRGFALLAGLLIISSLGYAQSTVVSGTVTDNLGQVWSNGSITAVFYGTPGYPPPFNWSGGSYNPYPPTVTLSPTGIFSITLPSNNAIAPGGSQWTFTVCPNATFTCASVNIPLTTSTIDISSLLTAAIGSTIIQPIVQPTPVNSAYGNSEVKTPPAWGHLFFDTTLKALKFWNGTTWVQLSTGPTPTITATTSVLKGDGAGNAVAAVDGTDYLSPVTGVKLTSGTTQTVSQGAGTSLLVNNINYTANINGDGSTDNTSAIQVAVNACPQYPTATFGQSCAINLNNVVIAGTITIPIGADYIFTGTQTTLCTGSGVNCFQRNVGAGIYEAHRIKFRNFYFVKSNTGAVIADLQVFNSQGNQGATIDSNTFILTGSAVGWIAQGGCFNAVTNNVFTGSRNTFQNSDTTGVAIQPQGSAGSFGAMVTMITNNSFNYLQAVVPVFVTGENNSWEGWTFTQNKFSQSPVTVSWGNEVNFIGNDLSGAKFTIGGAVFNSNVSNNYFDSNAMGDILITVQNLVGPNAALQIENNHFELGGKPNQTGIYFQGGGGTTGVNVIGNTYSGISPSTGTSFSITTNVLTVTVANTFVVGEIIGLDSFTTGTYLNGQTVTVVSASATQFTAAFTHANVSTTTDAGRSFPVSYGIWFNDVSLRNLYLGGENFRLNWAALHFTGTLDRSTIESFEARDVHFYADNLAANAGTYLRSPYLYIKIPIQVSGILPSPAAAGTFGLSLIQPPLFLFPGFTFNASTTSCSANTSLSLSQTSDGAISAVITATVSATPGFNHCEGVVTFDGTLYVPPR